MMDKKEKIQKLHNYGDLQIFKFSNCKVAKFKSASLLSGFTCFKSKSVKY